MKFLMYDVETANRDVGSICAVGWACVEHAEVTESGYSLINPNMHFSPYNTRVHGLTEKDVQNAPTFGEYWESTLKKHMESSVVVAHNASFDIRATEQALCYASIDDPGIDYIDTLPIFRELLPELKNHKLPTCAKWAGFKFRHHNAGEDALAIVAVVNALCKERGYHCMEELVIYGLVAQNTLTNNIEPKKKKTMKPVGLPIWRSEDHPSAEPTAPEDYALLGCKFCITGDVPGMDREQVQALIERHGGRMTSSVSRQTRFLICGTYADYPDDYISGKHRKALELLEQGAAISLIDAKQFIDLMRDPMSNEFFCRYADETQARQQQEKEKSREKERKGSTLCFDLEEAARKFVERAQGNAPVSLNTDGKA